MNHEINEGTNDILAIALTALTTLHNKLPADWQYLNQEMNKHSDVTLADAIAAIAEALEIIS
jgi:hypothetical protein